MNNERRKKINKIIGLVSEARSFLEELSEDERTAVDNMPDAFRETEQGERREEIAMMLEESVGALEEIESSLEECTT